MGEFQRKPGEKLGLSLDLRPAPNVVRYVTAFLYDKDGAALTPASVNLTDLGSGKHVESATIMQSIAQMRAKYRVFFDAGRTEPDECEYLGSEDVFDLDELAPSQLPPDSSVTGTIQGEVTVEAEINDEIVDGKIDSENLSGKVEDPDEIEALDESTTVSGEINEEEIDGKIEC